MDEFAARCGENGDCPLDASSEIPEASLRDAELDDRADWRDDGSAPEDGSADPREAASDVGSQGEAGDTGVEDGAVSDAGADAPFDACALGICEDFSGDASLAARGWSTVDSQGRLSIVHDDGGDGLAIDLGRTGNFMAYVSRPWDAAAPPIRCAFTLRMNLPEPDAGSDYLVDPLVLSAGNGDELYTRLFTRRGSNTWTVYLGTNGLGAPSGTKLEVSSFIPAPVVFQLESSLYSGNTAGSLAANGSLATAPLDGGFPARTMFPSTVNVNLGVSRFAVPVAGASLVLSKVRCVPE